MNARKLVVAASVLALALPAAATARTEPIKAKITHAAVHKQVTKQVPAVKRRTLPLCICITVPVTPVPLADDDFERLYDQELIDAGLAPIYGTGGTAALAAIG